MRRSWRERLWSRIDQSGGQDACWLWRGRTEPSGYGRLNVGDGKRVLAHRLAYADLVGDVPQGLQLRHLCEGRYAPGDITCRRCCNPAHLKPGTAAENMSDRDANGRGVIPDNTGERNGQAKLTADQVREIRAWSAAGGWTQDALAEAFGVSRRLVGLIQKREIWKCV